MNTNATTAVPESSSTASPNAEALSATDIVLQGSGLVKSFGQTVALAGVDFAVRRGESVAIMGPSGSGKSTLLHCLAGIMRPDSGQVHLLSQRIDSMSERERSRLRRTRFGFLFQFGQLLPELPAEENVALPLMLDGNSRTAAVATARSWFGPLGLDGLQSRRPGELSGGQAQRVALARALVTRPVVVFADEPTGALDQATGTDTMRTLIKSTKGQGTCLVVVTHDPAVAAHCDRTIEVRDGRITLANGTAPQAPATAPGNTAVPSYTVGRSGGPGATPSTTAPSPTKAGAW